MRTILVVSIILAVCAMVYGAVSIIPDDKSDHPGHCYSKETGPMEVNAEVGIKPCGRKICQTDKSIVIHTCGVVASPCGTISDSSKPYPECCPQPKPC